MTERGIAVDTMILKPEITLSTEDYVKLSALVRAMMNRMPELADGLSEELERARIIEDEHFSAEAVRMGGEVDFRDDTTGKTRTVTLVYPAQADIVEGKVSVLTPIGTALIGLRAGQSISWNTRSGETRRLTVLRVRNAAQRELAT
jgi:regulator of nucleoside diphosphate kinase